MKTRTNLKALTLLSLSTLLMGAAGGVLADAPAVAGAAAPGISQPTASGGACPRAPRMALGTPHAPSHPDDGALMAETMARFAAIEQAVREGRISAYDAGRLMRWQWDVTRFRQGFREGMQVAPAATPPAPASGGDACAEPFKDLANVLAPLGGLAVNGMQAGMRNAAGLMRVLTREVGKLLAEEDVRAHGMSL